MEHLLANLSGKVRRATLQGREYLVAPLSMIVPGVLNGSNGPLFYPLDEIGRNYSAWNGMPIVVNHPVENGKPLSARQPAVLEKYQIGTVFNADVNGKLGAEGWFDIELTRRIEPRIYAALNEGRPIELSTGLYTDNEKAIENSEFNGVRYTHIARNYRPDHLAVLPDNRGACSLKDGCGVLVNESDKKTLAQKVLDLFGLGTNGDGQPSGSSDNPVNKEPTVADKKMTDNDRKAIVDELVANCDCYKGSNAEDLKTLNGFSDERLVALKEQHDKAKQAQLSLNAAAAGVTDKEGNQYTFNGETGKWDMKPAAPKKPEPTANTKKDEEIVTPTTDNADDRLTADEREAIEFARNERNRQKSECVAKLVANVKDANEKKSLEAIYNKQNLNDLKAQVKAMPAPARPQPGFQSYAGAQGAPTQTVNRNDGFDENDVLIPPTTNWEEEAKRQSQAERRRAMSTN